MAREKKRTKQVGKKKQLTRARAKSKTPKKTKKKVLKKKILASHSRPSSAQPLRNLSQPAKPITAYDVVLHNFDIAAAKLQLSDELKQLIKTPDRELRVELPIIMDDGKLNTLIGCSTITLAARTKAGSVIIRRLTSMKCGHFRR